MQELARREIYRKADIVPPQLGFIVKGLVKGFYTDINGEVNVIYFGAEGDPVGDYLAFARQSKRAHRMCCAGVESPLILNEKYHIVVLFCLTSGRFSLKFAICIIVKIVGIFTPICIVMKILSFFITPDT